MDSLFPLLKGVRLLNDLFGPLDVIMCLDCRKKYKEWKEYCDKCGSDLIYISDPNNDGQFYLNLSVENKEVLVKAIDNGATPEQVKEIIAAEGQQGKPNTKKQKKRMNTFYRAAIFLYDLKISQTNSPATQKSE